MAALCRQDWYENQDKRVQFYCGTVKPYPESGHLAHIQRDEGIQVLGGHGDVCIAVQHSPRNCSQPGNRVERALKASCDRKKDRESVQAVRIRCAQES